jgi:hypothetical protein
MPYTLFQGGARRRRVRRRRPPLRLVALLLVAAAVAFLVLRDDAPKGGPTVPGAAAPLTERAPEPLSGGGTAPTELGIRLSDPRDSVPQRFRTPPRAGVAS